MPEPGSSTTSLDENGDGRTRGGSPGTCVSGYGSSPATASHVSRSASCEIQSAKASRSRPAPETANMPAMSVLCFSEPPS